VSEKFDWIIGSDIVYGAATHSHLQRIFDTNLAPDGRVLLSDPVRYASVCLLEMLEETGWRVTSAERHIGEGTTRRTFTLFELTPPQEVASDD
jgi:methyltransferase-like protein 23